MAAYAALVSLMNLIDDINHHHSPPISLHKHQIQSLIEYVIFLQEFLQAYKSPFSDSDEADPLERRIADAAYAAEDVIESHIVHNIQLSRSIADTVYLPEDVTESHIVDKIQHGRPKAAKIRRFFSCCRGPKDTRNVSSNHNDDDDDGDPIKLYRGAQSVRNVSSNHNDNRPIKLYKSVQNVIEEMDRIKRVAMETNTEKVVVPHRFVLSSTGKKKSSGTMVFSDHVLNGIMEKLVADEPSRQVVPITGMGGIGKTALAQTVYSEQVIKERFDIRAWATISEQYNTREILCELVSQATNKDKEQLSERSEDELGLELYQYLSGRRFLIVMDDVWSIESWNEMQHFFPNNGNSSRIMVTTRLSQLSFQLNNHYSHQMEFLDEVSSWILFSKTVFGEESFPLELEKIGKEIANNCRGLPLSIVVVGGVLKNMEHIKECWESIKNNLTSVVNSENDKHCLKLLKMSYNHLPVFLKPCFLYMGVFEEDDAISVSTLIKLWVSEGFLKPLANKSLETIGKEFLKDLVDRNLVLVHKLGHTGNIKVVKVHDLLRDLCLDQAKKEGFYHVIGESSPQGVNMHRRAVVRKNTSRNKVFGDLRSISRARSIICEHGKLPWIWNLRMLRTLHAYKFTTDEYRVNYYMARNVNMRHLAVKVVSASSIFSSYRDLWNLRTLIIICLGESIVPIEIWKMPQLRHIKIWRRHLLSDPSPDGVVMENLVILKGAHNFKCDEEVVKRIPNIKKLGIRYSGSKGVGHDDYYCLSNIKRLSKLESLDVSCEYDFRGNASLYKLTFPQTLMSLTLEMEDGFEWEMMLEKIGSLPLLEKFKLHGGCFRTGKWEIFEGQFPCLKYLGMFSCRSMKRWTAEEESSIIFPRLENLHLSHLEGLENIPSEIGFIPTLQKLWIVYCSESVVICAKEIVEEQMDLQGDDLPFHVQVRIFQFNSMNEASLISPNFEVVY